MFTIHRFATVIGASLLSRVSATITAANVASATAALALATTTTTIPWIGDHTATHTLLPCAELSVTVTIVIQVPIAGPSCTAIPEPPSPDGSCLVNPFCSPSGLNIDYYRNYLGDYSYGDYPSSYYITENLSPLDSSLTNRTFFPQDKSPTGLAVVYPSAELGKAAPYWVGWTRDTNGGITVDANNFTLVYSGFYRAPATGTYSLCTSADNRNEIFFGDGNALDCLSGAAPADATPLAFSTGGNFVNGVNCTEVDLVAGRYYPVRNVYGDWEGPSALSFTVQGPGEDQTYDLDGDVYPLECGSFF
ncbi:Floculation protein FLO1 [Hypoxylon rubiginosum]|uniref:Floculation protein FLO1 n=1 Tax=Hypoxylon rubiginosum TaxID=110542 RepID=A0ACB9YSF0_9PEZI|nr:Floculation protein FLO1 [Hypoxylon rubiginosum]